MKKQVTIKDLDDEAPELSREEKQELQARISDAASRLSRPRSRSTTSVEPSFMVTQARTSSARTPPRSSRATTYEERIRRRKIGQIYLYRRNFIGGFYGASEIFLTPRKTTV